MATSTIHTPLAKTILGILGAGLASFFALYLFAAYVALPAYWRAYARSHPAMASAETRTKTSLGILGDPINLAFVGTEDELITSAEHAGWTPADPITWRSSARIAIDSATRKPYSSSAPVSDLFVWGRKQDIAFEKPFGPDPRQRHHVRFWKSSSVDASGRPLWLGAATFDKAVGVSHLTGQVTHHIDANIDKERDILAADLAPSPNLHIEWFEGFQSDLKGKNGGGDPWFTDGRLCVLRFIPDSISDSAAAFFAPILDLLQPSYTSRR